MRLPTEEERNEFIKQQGWSDVEMMEEVRVPRMMLMIAAMTIEACAGMMEEAGFDPGEDSWAVLSGSVEMLSQIGEFFPPRRPRAAPEGAAGNAELRETENT